MIILWFAAEYFIILALLEGMCHLFFSRPNMPTGDTVMLLAMGVAGSHIAYVLWRHNRN